jgi:hypothetical protein
LLGVRDDVELLNRKGRKGGQREWWACGFVGLYNMLIWVVANSSYTMHALSYIVIMKTLTLRVIDEEVSERLKRSASKKGWDSNPYK